MLSTELGACWLELAPEFTEWNAGFVEHLLP